MPGELTWRTSKIWLEAKQIGEDSWWLLSFWLYPHPDPIPRRMVPANPAVLAGAR